MVFPIADDNTDRTSLPIVNVILIAINVFVFVVLQGMGSNLDFTFAFSTVPAEIVSGRDLVTDDQTVNINSVDGPRQVTMPGLRETPVPVYLTLLTSMFMHGGLAHLLGNMWFLWIFGDNIEHDLGRGRYLAFYLLCGILASLVHVVLNASGPSSTTPSLGASGAISGVMGAYLLLHPRRQVTVLLFRIITQVPGFVAVGLWFVFQIISSLGMLGGMESGVAHGAHIGGFIAGAALAKPFMLGRAPSRQASFEDRRRGGRSNWFQRRFRSRR
jgi:membrane associated rhomboid family serine protease